MDGAFYKLSMAYRRHGLAVARMALGRIFPAMLPRERILIYSQPLAANQQLTNDYVISRIKGISDPLSAVLQSDFGDSMMQRMADSNKECYVALSNEKIAGYAWTTVSELFIEEIDHVYVMQPDELFIFDCFVREDFRGRGIYPALLAEVMDDQVKRHPWLKKALIGASAFNRSSKRGIVKAGFTQHSSITREAR